jgi:hypothetical protein
MCGAPRQAGHDRTSLPGGRWQHREGGLPKYCHTALEEEIRPASSLCVTTRRRQRTPRSLLPHRQQRDCDHDQLAPPPRTVLQDVSRRDLRR